MDVHDRTLGFTGREVLFRPIIFERYRKPQVVEYPRHAIVLNPHHTKLQRETHATHSNQSAGDAASSEDDGDLGKEEENVDDDDPRNMDKNTFLCSDLALTRSLHLRWMQVGPVGVGLVNLGNTCFANAVIQAIAYTPGLAQYVAQTFLTPDTQLGAPYDFAYALGETVRQVHLRPRHTSGGAYRPALIVGRLKTLSSHFSIGRQSDAHEFAVQLLFACQKSILFRQVGSRKLPPRVVQTTALHRICGGYLRSQVAWRRQEEVQQLQQAGKRQAAVDLQMEGSARGADRIVSNTYDPSTVLHVELAGHSLEHCLAKFCEVEKLHGRCYHTPRDVSVHATKQFLIHIPPNILIIHLKRFSNTGGKVSKYIQYPKLLDLTPFTTAAEGKGHNNVKGIYQYELNAVCIHEGSSINYGHYYSVVRSRSGAWYQCSDSHVSPLSEERALRQQAAILFYSRIVTRTPAAAVTSGHPARHPREQPVTTLPAAKAPRWLEANGTWGHAVEAPTAVGKALSEAEVSALLAARQLAKKEAEAEGHPLPDPTSTGLRVHGATEKPQLVLKRRREDLSTDDDEDEGDVATPAPGERITEKENERPNPPQQRNGSIPSGGLNRSRYGGIIKAMRRSASCTSSLARSAGDGAHDHNLSTSRDGLKAVVAMEQHKRQSMPETVQRRADAPKFQQRVRDPLWEMEMDRGRVKKVKNKKPEEQNEGPRLNAFQELSAHRFDRRGRRTQRDL